MLTQKTRQTNAKERTIPEDKKEPQRKKLADTGVWKLPFDIFRQWEGVHRVL